MTDADLQDGLLSIDMVREIPEAMKPRKISIGDAIPKQDAIESKAEPADA